MTNVSPTHRAADAAAASRNEKDTLGQVSVPADALWGAQTQRAIENFHISARRIDREVIATVALVKWAAARANAECGVLPTAVADAIADAADLVVDGTIGDAQFPLDVFQTGSGTSTNMNVNEVIANLASRRLDQPVHPNDHVNASQSSNDVIPTAIHLAALVALRCSLFPALDLLRTALESKADEHIDVVKSGRTHLMDATPVTVGQELRGYAAHLAFAHSRLAASERALHQLALGGTAVGTGMNAPTGFAATAIARLAQRLSTDLGQTIELNEAGNHFAAQSGQDAALAVSADLRSLAVALVKICNDLRWMSSGPRTGLAEIRLPALQPGSSIMPGKVNPVVPEAVAQACAQVIGNDSVIAFAASQGAFELNTYLPVISSNLLESIRVLANSCELLSTRCVRGIEVDEARCRSYAESSPSLATALSPLIGYEQSANIAKRAAETGQRVRDIVLADGLLSAEELDTAFDLLGMAGIRPAEPPKT